MSRAIAMIILRKFSACDSARLLKLIWPILVTPSTSVAISLPKICSICGRRRERVLDGVVQESRDDARDVEAEVGDQGRDLERVDQVGLARLPLLSPGGTSAEKS
jgi:hypothetical protein